MSIVGADDTVSPHIAHRRAFLQEFIDTGTERPFDVRAYVVVDRIVGAMKRYAPPDEWRTNVAVGAEVEDFTADLPRRRRRLSREAADVLDLDYAGVDLLCRDGAWYVLEVNATAGFKGLFEATGTSPRRSSPASRSRGRRPGRPRSRHRPRGGTGRLDPGV